MGFQFKLEFRKGDGTGVSVATAPDLAPALECCRWEAVRRGLLSPGSPARGGRVEPLWHAEGAPYLKGLRVTIETPEGPFAHEIPPGCLKADSSEVAARLVNAGYLEATDEVTVLPTAWPSDRHTNTLTCREVEIDLPLRNGPLGGMLERSREVGPQHGSDMPVFIAEEVLAQAAEAARRATPLEIGGVLIGHLHRSDQGLFTEITAAVPAIEAVSSETELRFTPAAWAAVRGAVDLRGSGELLLGWYHSHPVRADTFGQCSACPPEKQKQCPVATALFSRQDRFLHKTIYLRAFTLGLVANDLTEGVVFSCFGWRDGVVAQRGFHELTTGES